MFFIFGFSPVKKAGTQVVRRHCPRCNDLRNFQEVFVRQYVTFFFIPIFPVSASTTIYTCSACSYSIGQEMIHENPAPVFTGDLPDPASRVIVFCPRCDGAMTIPLKETHQEITCPHCSMEFKVNGIKGTIPLAAINENPQSV
jgi:hypothetical protein